MRNNKVKMDKPIYIGFTVLELSKLHMYRLHYAFFKYTYQDDLKLAYMDTDSFIYYIKTSDIFKDYQSKFYDLMDFSDYPKDHPCYNEEQKKKIGYLKDEMNSKQICEFVGLKPKMYIIRSEEKLSKRAKGVKKSVLQNEIDFTNYFDCLFYDRCFIHSMKRLESKNHKIRAIEQKKLSLSPLDDKRFILDDKIHTLAHYHYDTRKS